MQRREFLIEGGRAALGFGAVVCCVWFTHPPVPRDAFLESLVAAWETAIPQWLQETKMPAVSIAIIRDGRLAWRRAFGVKDTGTNEPVDVDSVFAACSDTKPVFAYGVVKLGEKGVLNLDTPLTKYTSRRITADPRVELITARHVLNHTTGFPNWRQGTDLPIEFDAGLAEPVLRRRIQLSAVGGRGDHRQVVRGLHARQHSDAAGDDVEPRIIWDRTMRGRSPSRHDAERQAHRRTIYAVSAAERPKAWRGTAPPRC